MNTGEESRSEKESAPKKEVTCNDASNSEDEIFAWIERAMRRVVVKHDLTGVTCYRCMERGHLGLHCPKGAKGVGIVNQTPSVTSNVRCLLDLPNLEEGDATGEIVHEEEEVIDDSEDEFLALLDQVVERAYIKRDPKDYICYLCKKKGHLARDCPTKEEEGVAAELAKPRAPKAAWCDETFDDEGRIDNVPNRLCLMEQPSLEEEEEVSEKLFLVKIESLDQKMCVKVTMLLWNERENFVLDNEDNIMSTLVDELMSKNQEYDDVQDNGHEYYHPEYGPHPELEYYLEHYPEPGKAKLPWVRKN